MRDYQSMGGMESQSAGAPSYAAPGRGQEPAYGAELRFGTPSASVIARVPSLSTDPLASPLASGLAAPLASPLAAPLATPASAAEEAHAVEQGWRAWFTRKAVAGVAAVVLLAAVSPWVVGLLRDKTESETTADAKDKAPEVRVEFPAPNESEAPAWGGARSDSRNWQTADSRDARRRSSVVESDDADPDADRRDARRSETGRADADRSQYKRTSRSAADVAHDDADDARAPARSTARTAARRTAVDRDADRAENPASRSAGIARRGDSRPTTLSERSPLTPPEGDRTSVSGAANAPSRPRFDGAEDRGDTRMAVRGTPRYEARGDAPREESSAAGRRGAAYDPSDAPAGRTADKRRGAAAQDKFNPAPQDRYSSPRDREETASRRGGVSRDRSPDTIPTAYQDDYRASDSPRSRSAERSGSTGGSRFDDSGAAPGRRVSPGASRDDRDESPYGFSRRDGGSSQTPAASRATEPAEADGDIAPRYPETRSAAPDRDDYGSRAPSKAASRGVRSASYESTDQDLARFQGGIEEPTYRTSYERTGSSIR